MISLEVSRGGGRLSYLWRLTAGGSSLDRLPGRRQPWRWTLPTQRDETGRLRDLHEDYAWQVNAAIGEDREDLVRKLSDEYLVKAMQVMTDGHPSACERSGSTSGIQPRAAGARRTFAPARLWRLLRWWRAR